MERLSDKALLKLMKQKGSEFCEEIMWKWWRGDYDKDEEIKKENVKHWKENKARINSFKIEELMEGIE